MPKTIEEFDALISEIEKNDEIKESSYLTDGVEEELHPKLQEVIGAACGLFITGKGSANFSNINKSKYRIVGGIGWLTGVIITSKGRIVYG